MAELSLRELERLASFKGYGNSDGDYWFVGWEEHVDRDRDMLQELKIRATWPDIADLDEANQSLGTNPDHYVPTWSVMIRILLKLKGMSEWADGRVVRNYQVARLGRKDDETFLAEVWPLPSPSTADWPYRALFADRKQYRETVWSRRLEALQSAIASRSPKFAICYGKGNWNRHMELFPGEYEPVLDGQCMAANIGETTVALTWSFSPQYLSIKKIDRLCDELWRVRRTRVS